MNQQNNSRSYKRSAGASRSANHANAITRAFESSVENQVPMYLDDDTLQKMIASFGPLDYNQFAATIYPQDPLGVTMNWQNDPQWLPQQPTPKVSHPQRSTTPEGKYALPQIHQEQEESNPEVFSTRRELLMDWFDRSIKQDLQNRVEQQQSNSLYPSFKPKRNNE